MGRSEVMKKERGFNLLELMVVVAVLGILAAVAIPKYGDHLKRTQAMAGFVMLSSFKPNIEQYVIMQGSFPQETDSEIFQDLGVSQQHNLGEVHLKASSSNVENGTLTFDFNTNSQLKEQSLQLVRNDGMWQCITQIDENLRPIDCTDE